MKKSIVILLVITLAFSFVGCTKKATNDNGKQTVRLLTDATGIDDKSFNASAWEGIVRYYGEKLDDTKSRGVNYDVVTASDQDMYVPNLKQASDEGYDLITVTGFTWSGALSEVAPLYPDQKYAIIDVDWVPAPNIMQFSFREDQGSYLVGVAAALKAVEDGIKNPKFGFIGGVPGAVITKFEVGYIQGILSVLPNAEIVDYYANDWGKPELAKAKAKSWYDDGVYAIFSAAGGTGNGTIAMAKEERAKGKNVWAIGVDSDQFADGLYNGKDSAVLTSMIKRVDNALVYALDAVENNKFVGNGCVVLDLKENGVDYSQANPVLTDSIKNKLAEVKQKIVDGQIVVIPTYKEALAKGLAPKNLKALDD